MLESLILFAILVLTAKAAGISNAMTVLGAQLFFWSRVAYAVIYIAGIPWARTAAWAVSVIGLLLIFLQLVQVGQVKSRRLGRASAKIQHKSEISACVGSAPGLRRG